MSEIGSQSAVIRTKCNCVIYPTSEVSHNGATVITAIVGNIKSIIAWQSPRLQIATYL
jgi:hypothetical protein